MDILELLATEYRGLSLAEVSEKMGWPKTTVYGLLSTLREYEMVEQSPQNGRYSLGKRLFELGSAVARGWDVRQVALPYMRQINEKYGEMVQLGMEAGGQVLYVEKLDSKHMLRIVSEIGGRLPMHCTGLGKVLLAYKSYAEVKRILTSHGMKRMTRRTILTLPEMEKELANVRLKGYATDDREIMDALRCVAVPIKDQDGTVRYAVSVSGLSDSFGGAYLEEVLESLKDAGRKISEELGYRE
jgi:DNA-binding IclR family transcriptional regulator